jgi:Na+/proline symporter
MVAGIYLKRTTPGAAILSMVAGMGVWLVALALDTTINPLLYGLAASIFGLITGILFARKEEAVG